MLRKTLKLAGAETLFHSGLLSLTRRWLKPGGAAVLMYHRVNDAADPFFPSLPVAVFRKQLDYLSKHYRIVPLETAVEWAESGARGVPRVALTIDDGYPDTHACVLPELAARGLTASLFLSTGPLETGHPLWPERVRFALKHARRDALSLPELQCTHVELETEGARLQSLRRLLSRLKRAPAATVEAALDAIDDQLQPDGPSVPVLRWDEVRAMTRDGHIRIGAHTHRHYILSQLDDETLAKEIRTSMELITSTLGTTVETFCYPNGGAEDYDARAVAWLRKLGIRYAVTTRSDFLRPGAPALELPRLYTSERHLSLFAARLAGLGKQPRWESPGAEWREAAQGDGG